MTTTSRTLSWQDDILGPGFEQATLQLPSEDDGELAATLVRYTGHRLGLLRRLLKGKRPLDKTAILYVHGWSDYFFQTGLAKTLGGLGAQFYALDLRRYGRSLREGNRPYYVGNLDEYDTEINWAVDEIRSSNPSGRLVLLGHSTGGLVLSLWAARHPEKADALLLNSPWLELQAGAFGRNLLRPLIDLGGDVDPHRMLTRVDSSMYARTQAENACEGEPYDPNCEWRPMDQPMYAGWLKAIVTGQEKVAKRLHLKIPVCVLLSSASELPLKWTPQQLTTDTVLVVDEIAKASLNLGQSVTIERIDGAIHDVFLSRTEVRREAYRRVVRWLTALQ